ncbi:MAG: nitrophenyl compound nitroreductase subunit ArsF family protein [Candidatus Omnitrophota bacterium]
MKKLFLVLLAVAVLSSGGIILSSPAEAGDDAKGAQVIAYYFHGDMRCPTCHKLEQYSKEAIETNFKDALASGKLEYKVVNVEDKGNEHYAGDYQLYTKSLILSLVKDGKEIKWKNMDKIWEYVGNKNRFLDYVKSAVADLLKEAE